MKKITLPKKTIKSIPKKIERELEELARQQEYYNQFKMVDKGGIEF